MAEVKKVKKAVRTKAGDDSEFSLFVERPVPSDKEVKNFERAVEREEREKEIDSNLSEIYSDQEGGRIDVKKMNIKRRPKFIVRFLRNILILGVIGVAAYFAYSYWFSNSSDVSSLELKITAPEKILAGEEFSYQIDYHNPTKYPLSQVRLELQYPDNFIFSSASLAPNSGNYGWNLADLAPGASGSITVKGQLVAETDAAKVIFAHLSYLPGTFTSQYKKDATASTIISGLGFQVDLESSATAFINQDNEMTLVFSDIKNNNLGDFDISFALPAETDASVVLDQTASNTASSSISSSTAGSANKIAIVKSGGASWQVTGLLPGLDRQEVPLTYKIRQKSANQEIKVRLEKKMADGQSYIFWEKSVQPELVSSDLNLTMILNGSKNDGAVNFGQPLNYSLTYANKGTSIYKDVVIMAAINGDFLDWNSLHDDKKGDVKNKTIIWTKNEIPELAEIQPGAQGEIDFSLNLLPFKDSDLGKSLTIVSYGQYSMNNKAVKGEDNKSNTITSKINSDLSLTEQVRYFNEDNVPVGSGPLPPKVGEKTSFKVFWTVKNNLHELSGTRAVFTLPSYVSWDNSVSTNVGSLSYDDATRQVVWEIGRLPVSVYRADAEFGISITPAATDRNKILVLSSGSSVSAMDTETKNTILKKTGSKTTKLEDDDIAGLNNSGIVQ